MDPTKISATVNQQTWLAPIEKALEALSDKTIGAAPVIVSNFLHGTWLGHPLHAAITDVPVGAWSVTATFDLVELLSGTEDLRFAADAAANLGLVAALGAAASGLCDWSKAGKRARRIGALHALLNISSALCYAVSCWQRNRENRAPALAAGFTGYGLLLAGTFLGGHLSYAESIGIDHAQRDGGPKDWTTVLGEGELAEFEPRRVEAGKVSVLLVKKGTQIFAIGEKCAHLGGPLSKGELDGTSVQCPWHGSRFSLEDGRVLEGPAVYSQPCFAVRVQNGEIQVRSAGDLSD
ncbi:MAG: Rieske 2Fe-2S domain-containing protein [Verrucomicrobia bacterium]|nr:Rieske 2Fe-2S domain-containing protein [Verrucomicrobiota bacterium]